MNFKADRRWLIGIGVVLALLTVLVIASGCAAHVGPSDERGWISWDICGWEGGVAAELQVLALTARLGCTSPKVDEDAGEDE